MQSVQSVLKYPLMNNISYFDFFFLLSPRCIINRIYNIYKYMDVHLLQILISFVLRHVCETFSLDFNLVCLWWCSIVSRILRWVCNMIHSP